MRLKYRSNRTQENENFEEITSAMHFGSDAAVCVFGRGGGGVKDNVIVIGLRYTLSLIIKYSKSRKNVKI